jgi:outer membrane protein TolC
VEGDQGNARNAAIQLGLLLDAPPPTTLASPDAMLEASRRPVADVEPLVRGALQRRLDLSSLQHAAQAAHDAAREPLLRLAPTLGFSGQAQATTNTDATGRWADGALQLTLTWVLYDAGQRYADLHSRDASAQIADLQALARARGVQADVQGAVTTLQAAQNTFAVADKAVAVAHRNASETEALYKQGLAKAIELIDANDQVFLAEVSDAEARYSMALAYLDLRLALGLDPLGLELP